jgi:hypothetical protein
MEAFWIGYSILGGALLIIADGIAAEVKKQYGQRPGLAVWLFTVLMPLVVVCHFSPKVALASAVIGTVLSFAVTWLKHQVEKEHRGEPTSPLLRLF